MTSNRNIIFLFFLLSLLVGCAPALTEDEPEGPRQVVAGLANGATLPVVTGPNVVPITVNGSLCSAGSYINKPCVSVTICTPGTNNCDTIDDMLLDTGSFGIRVFGSLLSNSVPTQINVAGQALAGCAQFGDGSALWGQIKLADVKLGGESAVSVPIQTIDSTFSNGSTYCPSPDADVAAAGFNGIIGVGVFVNDCGTTCTTFAANGIYFRCNAGVCAGTTVPLSSQVKDPVAALTTNNNGVILQLPSIPLGGLASIETGYMILGIGTQSNNAVAGVTAYPADPLTADFTTTFAGHTRTAFVDSGSNALYFPSDDAGLTDCTVYGLTGGWYCPPSTVEKTATITGDGGSPAGLTSFYIGNLWNLLHTPYYVFIEIGGDGGGMTLFDWGLPFYIGRNVYLGFEGTTSDLGNGPIWGF